MPEQTQTIPNQQIVRLDVSNFMRVEAVEILVDSGVMVIGGENAQGKSSVLLAIEAALGGTRGICEQPIKLGKSKAHVIAELNDIVVTRQWSAKGGTTLTVTTKEGSPLRAPQEVLDSLLGSLSFDPLYFSRLASSGKADERAKAAEMLRKLVGLDFTALDAERKSRFEKRRVVNAQAETMPTKLLAYPADPTAPKEEADVTALQAQLSAAFKENEARVKKAAETDTFEREISQLKSMGDGTMEEIEKWHTTRDTDLARLKERYDQDVLRITSAHDANVARLTKEAETYTSSADAKEKERSTKALELAESKPAETESLQKQILNSQTDNTKVRVQKRRGELLAEQRELTEKADGLTDEIEAIDAKKAKMLAESKFPVPEISFSDAEVLLEQLPFSQGSSAQRLRASVAIGMALNPKLRVMLIREGGNDLDESNLKLVGEIAKANKFQVWI